MLVAHSYRILKFFKLHNVPVRPNIHTDRIDSITIVQYYSIALNELLFLRMDWDLVVVRNWYIGGYFLRC